MSDPIAVDPIEDVARYAGGSHVDSRSGVVNGSAFDRTPKDNDGVSVTRRFVLSKDNEEDRNSIRAVVGSRLKLGTTGLFLILNVGDIYEALKDFDQEIFVVEDPLEREGHALANPAHALILGLPFAGESVGSLRSEVAGDRLRQKIKDRFPSVKQ